MQTVLILFHVGICIALILIVLLQTGRGAEMGAAFGGSSQTLFGTTSGTTFMDKVTTLTAIVFMLTCLGLTYMSGRPNTKSVMENVKIPAQPAVPKAQPVQGANKAKPRARAQTPAPEAKTDRRQGTSAQPGTTAPAQGAAQPAPDSGSAGDGGKSPNQ